MARNLHLAFDLRQGTDSRDGNSQARKGDLLLLVLVTLTADCPPGMA
jgi:hypothetical protein